MSLELLHGIEKLHRRIDMQDLPVRQFFFQFIAVQFVQLFQIAHLFLDGDCGPNRILGVADPQGGVDQFGANVIDDPGNDPDGLVIDFHLFLIIRLRVSPDRRSKGAYQQHSQAGVQDGFNNVSHSPS